MTSKKLWNITEVNSGGASQNTIAGSHAYQVPSYDEKTHVSELLNHMMKEDKDSMLYRVLQSQIDNPGKGDWVHLMRQDIQDLNPNQMFENIARMLNIKWKPSSEKLSRKKKEAFKYLSDIQAGHSKTRNLRYSGLQLQPYLSI